MVNADNKKQAGSIASHILNPVEIPLPPRQSDSDYKRPKLTSQHFVPDIY